MNNNNKFIFRALCMFLLLLSIFPYVISIVYSPIRVDAGYYLSVVERLREGFSLYSDIKTIYSPLQFYLVAFVKNILNAENNYSIDLFIYFISIVVSAVFLYKIAKHIFSDRIMSFLTVIFLLQISFWIMPLEFLLDYPSVMWGIIGLWLLLTNKNTIITMIFAGLFFSFSFMTKQYGLGFLFLGLYTISINGGNSRFKNIAFLIISFSIPIVLYIVLNKDFLFFILGKGYGTQSSGGVLANSFNNIVLVYKYLLYRLPITVIAFLVFFYRFKYEWKNKVLILLGIFGFSLLFIFEPLHQYFFYIIPFLSLLIVFPLMLLKNSRFLKYAYVILLFISIVFSIKRNYVRVWNVNSNSRLVQYEIADSINRIIPDSSTVYIADYRLVYLYYLLNSKPIDLDYSFGVTLTPKSHFERIKASDYVIVWENYKTKYFDYLNTNELIMFYNERMDNGIIVYEKNDHLNEISGKIEHDRVVVC